MLQRLKITRRFCEEYTLDEIEDYWYGLLREKDLTSREHFYQEIRFIMKSVEPLDWEYRILANLLEQHIVKNYHEENIDHHYFILKEFQERGLACDNLSIKITKKIQNFHEHYSHIYWYMISEAALYRDHTEHQLMFQAILFQKALENIIMEIDEYDMCFIVWAIGRYSHVKYYIGLSEFMDKIIYVVLLRIQLLELKHYKLLLEYQIKSYLMFYLHLFAEFISSLEEFRIKQIDEITDILKLFFQNPHSYVFKTIDNLRSVQIMILSSGNFNKINQYQFEELSWIFHGYPIIQYYEEFIFAFIEEDPHLYPITISWLLNLGLLDDNNVTEQLIDEAFQKKDFIRLYHFYFVSKYFEDLNQVRLIKNIINSMDIDSSLPIRNLTRLLFSYSDLQNEIFTQQALNYIKKIKDQLDDITQWELNFTLKLAINNKITSAIINLFQQTDNQDLLLRIFIILTKEFLTIQFQKIVLALLPKIDFYDENEFFEYFEKMFLNNLRLKDFFMNDMHYEEITKYYIERIKKSKVNSYIISKILSLAQFLSSNQSENLIQRNTINDIVQICLKNPEHNQENQNQNLRLIFHFITRYKLPYKDVIKQNIDKLQLPIDTQLRSLIYIYDDLSIQQHQQLMTIYNNTKNQENWNQLQLLVSLKYSDVKDDIKQMEQFLDQQGKLWMTQHKIFKIIEGFNIQEIKNNLPAYYDLLSQILNQIISKLFQFDQDDWIHILHQYHAVGYKDEWLVDQVVVNFVHANYMSGDNILKLLKCLQSYTEQQLTELSIRAIYMKFRQISKIELYYPTILQLIYQKAIINKEAQLFAQEYIENHDINQEQLKSLIQINCLFDLQINVMPIDKIELNYLVVLYYQKKALEQWFTKFLSAEQFMPASQQNTLIVGEVLTLMGLKYVTNKVEKDIIYDFYLPDNDQYILLVDHRYQEIELFIDYLIDKLTNKKPIKINYADLLVSKDNRVQYFIDQGIIQNKQ